MGGMDPSPPTRRDDPLEKTCYRIDAFLASLGYLAGEPTIQVRGGHLTAGSVAGRP